MKSNICDLSGQKEKLDAVLKEVEKCAAFNDLNAKSTLRLRLLAEELVGMLPELLEHSTGNFWLENDGMKYELHVSVHALETGFTTREKLLSLSSTGKNAAAVGIMGKIRVAAENLLFSADNDIIFSDFSDYEMDSTNYNHAWSLKLYTDNIRNRASSEAAAAEAWDELEKSIVAQLADDVVVGIRGRQVDIIVRKEFA